ncbi:MAG TPA: threonine synthase [Bacillota bacterium]|jgi:threonine synthase|nr:threonine synthase [Bacillota bacterium]
MLYCSTRGEEQPRPATRAVLQGLAQDGGLFVPAAPLPRVALEPLLPLDYLQRAAAIIRPFLEEFSEAEMESMVRKAYGGGAFRHPSIAPLHRLDDRLYLLELWHGPTCAFKDMALQFLPHLLNAAAAKTGERATAVILTATSGDTGKAALEGFRDVPGTRVIVFYPEEGVSAIQRQQMVTQEGGNVHVAAVRGNFDDAQAGVKAIFADGALADKLACRGFKFTSANSINWGRLLPQVIYYFSAYLDLLASGTIKAGEKINFVVPTGNFGNILAGYYAARMGLPVGKLICAANQNNVLAEFFQTGLYNRNRPFYRTISPSMDILVSSNLERLLFELSGRDPAQVKEWMRLLKEKGAYQVHPAVFRAMAAIFWSDWAGDDETIAVIGRTYREYGYLLDPHTAVGKAVYDKYRAATGDDSRTVILSTASPFKFADSVARAVLPPAQCAGRSPFELLPLLAEATGAPIPAPLQKLEQLPVRHRTLARKEEMPKVVLDFLGVN